ncbi:hypothetical protein ACN22W_22280 [Burkholderia theae]|uniref:hypothetical protein n=1 Tax=Burkholderia theae TaxID=3143496 RepID=UPI003AFA0B62
MYSYEDRIRAVKLYLKLGKRLIATLAEGVVATDLSPDTATSEDHQLVVEIHEVVIADDLRSDLVPIRKVLPCGQPKAIRLTRLYVERFGKARTPAGAGAVGAA